MIWIYVVGMIVVLIGISAFFGAPYLPSHRKDIRRLFDDLAPIGKGDVVLDIGSGDGVVLREVSRRGAKAIGYEIHPLFVGISRLLSIGDKNVRVVWANAWTTTFPKGVTLVYIFSVKRDAGKVILKMQEEADRLNRPLTLVCYGNPLPNRDVTEQDGAYYLYSFHPLHRR